MSTGASLEVHRQRVWTGSEHRWIWLAAVRIGDSFPVAVPSAAEWCGFATKREALDAARAFAATIPNQYAR